MNYEDKTNADLLKMVTEQGLTVDAKNPKKPNKSELIATLQIANNTTEEVAEENDDFALDAIMEADKVEDERVKEETRTQATHDTALEVVKDKPKKLTRAQKKKAQYSDLMKLARVMITSNQTGQTKTELITVGWGNRLLGYNNDRVFLGKPWHVREGALRNLRDATVTEQVPSDKGGSITRTIPAYNIVNLGLLTMDEYKEMGEKQKMRDSAAEALA